MDRKRAMRNRALAGALTMALVSTGVVVVTDAIANPDPAIHVEGLELKMKTDPGTGKPSAQALVEISVTNQEFLQGVAMTLEYNADYLEPSDWVTNVGYGESGVWGDGTRYAGGGLVTDPLDYSDPLHHLFFRTDEDLFKGTYSDGTTLVDALSFWENEGTSTTAPSATAASKPTAKRDTLYVDASTQRVHFDLAIRSGTDERMKADSGHVKQAKSSRSGNYYYFENEATADNRVILGTLSFRVNEKVVSGSSSVEDLEQQLKDMVAKFNGLDWKYNKEGTVDPSKDDSGDKEYLFRESREERVQRQVKYLRKSGTTARPTYQPITVDHAIGIQISIEADDIIQDAWPVKNDITINSYQAYTNGDIGDLAVAMQNYADSVRVKRVSGKQSDMSIYWGDPVDSPTSDSMPEDGPGMIIRKAIRGMVDDGTGTLVPGWVEDTSSPRYRFKWNGSGFTVEEDAGSGFTPTTSAAVYGHGKLFDPRGNYLGDDQYGHYIIKQYFTYWERRGTGGNGDFVLKTFPKPVQVALHVTPINIIDATVEKQQITYRNDIDEVPQTFTHLDLAEEAKLIMDVAINGVTPTMPVSWTPTNSPAWVPGILDGNVVGVAGSGNPNETTPAPGNVANWPIGDTAISNKTGVGDYTFETQVLEADIQAKYPWVTTHGDYDPLNSYRRIVNVSPGTGGDPAPQLPRYVMWAEPYEVAPVGAAAGVTAGDPVARLRITIARQEATWNAVTEEWDWDYVNMDPVSGVDYQFKLYMPNDQQIMADVAGINWFGSAGSTYLGQRRIGLTDGSLGITNLNVYQFNISPGDLGAADTYAASRETLRQYINLGGWFSADILEPNATVWNDRISALSRPRTNIYTMSYILDPAVTPAGTETWLFDYTGNRAGLMPFYSTSDLPTYITLPADETVEVRYDALTGSQPGEMRQFKVDGIASALPTDPERWQHIQGNDAGPVPPDSPPWATPVPAASPSPAIPGEVVTYGEDLFERSYDYSGFGTVTNPNTSTITGYPTQLQDRKAKVRVEVQDLPPLPSDEPANWELTLTYEQNGDNVTEYEDGQVKRVTFENKMEGYTYQQVVTLTLTNTGNRDIRGLYIDIPDTPNGPCFRLITPPPTSLAVGASATFQLSYIQGLTEGDYEDIFTTEPIHIWHDNSGPADDGKAPDTLPGHEEGFEAVLKVTKTRPYRVTVVVHPNVDETGTIEKPMGDGWLVEGITTGSGTDTYSGVLGASVYELNDRFWVLTQPKDEYSLITMNDGGTPRVWVYYIRDDDATKTRVYLNEYNASGPNVGFGTADDSFVSQDNPERLFWGEMPDGSVTVHIHYYEPLLSKLRLSDLHAYAWDQQSEIRLKPDPIPAQAWEENPASTAMFDNLSFERPLNVRDNGSYTQMLFDPQKDEYIVLLEPYSSGNDNFCGVSIALRDLVTHINGIGDTETPPEENNVDIYPTVMMVLDDADGTIVCNDVPSSVLNPPPTPSTAGPTTHHSAAFSAPIDGPSQTSIAQTTVTITISYDGTPLIPPEGYESREYKVRFVRRMDDGKAKHIAQAGNSPYGMIENDATITDKAAAKATFDVNDRFDFSNIAHTPKQATELRNIYWPEAWEGGVNYDKDETALFVYAGQKFYDPGVKNIYNNAGDYIDGIEVSRSLEYVKLDTQETTPWDRFNVDPTVAGNVAVIDLGAVPAVGGTIPGDTMTLTVNDVDKSYNGMVEALESAEDIRPGVYQLKYSYTDYDGITQLSFTRPLIVLVPNGDVDAGRTVTDVDRVSIQQRFNTGTALPYELPANIYSETDELVYKYRIVDANNDRNINNIDAGMIRKVTTLIPTSKLTEFYRPTEYTYPVKPTP